MKIKEYKNKIVLAELDPDADYILLFNPSCFPNLDWIRDLQQRGNQRIYYVAVRDVEKTVRFVEVPKKRAEKTDI